LAERDEPNGYAAPAAIAAISFGSALWRAAIATAWTI
jgi:hypothetical protein